MICSFMRYCTFSSVTTSGLFSTMRSMSVLPKPARRAAILFTVGGNWQWSPANTTREALRMGIQQAASSAWAASSMKSVEAMTRASPKSSLLMRISISAALDFNRSNF